MENLINHLEFTLNEEECVKEALLLLKGCSTTDTDKAKSNRTRDKIGLIDNDMLYSYGEAMFLREDFLNRYYLSAKLIAHRLSVDFRLILEMCRAVCCNDWPPTFIKCYLKVINLYEECNLTTQTVSQAKIDALKFDAIVRLNNQRGT